MSIEPRPPLNQSITLNNLVIGMPIFEFGPKIAGVQQPLLPLGVVDNAALAKEIEELALESSHSGTRVTIRELITKIEPQFNVGVFNWAAEVLRFALGSGTLDPISTDPAAVITDESIITTTDPLDYLTLANLLINVGTAVLEPGSLTNESVGTSDGTAGATSGDFSLAFKVNAAGDVTSDIRVLSTAGVLVEYAPVAVGAASTGKEVEVVTGQGSDSGDLQFFDAGTPENVTGSITADYQPSFTLTEGLAGGVLTALGSAQSDDGGVFTDETADANSPTVGDVTLTPAVPAVSDAFYVGSKDPFNHVQVIVSTPGVDYTVVWEYFDGASYTAIPGLTDPSSGFLATAGTYDISFPRPADWAQDVINAIGPLFHVRARVATIGTPTGATGTQLFTSDGDDFVVDFKQGRVQVSHDADKASGFSPLISAQPLFIDYTYNRTSHTNLTPFTQTSFDGQARMRLLTDVGSNLIWNIPSAQVQLTGDEVAFADEDFTILTVSILLLDDAVGRFGTLEVYNEIQAGNA